MSRFTLVLLVSSVALVSACASTYQQETITAVQTKLAIGGTALVATPPDSAYGDENYPGSGAATASAVRSAFSRYTSTTEISTTCNDFACLSNNSKHYEYYLVPQILHWEDRATEWSGKKDKIEIKVTIYSPTGAVLGSNIISGKSKWGTFGGDHPQDLLPEPLKKYALSLF